MAYQGHLDILLSGVAAWNAWRKKYVEIHPDLAEANLVEANLVEANLHSVDLSGANLRKADMRGSLLESASLQGAQLQGASMEDADMLGANLEQANLQEASLTEANLSMANLAWANLIDTCLKQVALGQAELQGAILVNAKLQRADLERAKLMGADLKRANLTNAKLQEAKLFKANLREADLRWANLQEANLQEANLQGADLRGANLIGASLSDTRFSSRTALNDLARPLTDEQLSGAIFVDEQDFYSKPKQNFQSEAPTLRINFDDDKPWDAARFGMFFVTLHTAYAKLLYLATTKEEDEEVIHNVLDRRVYHLPPEQDIYLQSVATGSLDIELISFLSDPETFNALKALAVIVTGYTGALLAIPKFKEMRANAELKELEAEKIRRELNQTPPPTTPPAVHYHYYLDNMPTEAAEEEKTLAQEAQTTMNLEQIVRVLDPKSKTVRNSPDQVVAAARELIRVITNLSTLGKAPTEAHFDDPSDDDSDTPNNGPGM